MSSDKDSWDVQCPDGQPGFAANAPYGHVPAYCRRLTDVFECAASNGRVVVNVRATTEVAGRARLLAVVNAVSRPGPAQSLSSTTGATCGGVTTLQGFKYCLTYKSFGTTTDNIPPPYVGLDIRLSATNSGDRAFSVQDILVNSRPTVTVKVNPKKVRLKGTSCTSTCDFQGDFLPTQQFGLLAPGSSVEGPLYDVGTHFDQSITKDDVKIYVGPPDVGGDPAAGYKKPTARTLLAPPG